MRTGLFKLGFIEERIYLIRALQSSKMILIAMGKVSRS